MKVKDGYVEAQAMIARGEVEEAEDLLVRVAPLLQQFREWSGMYINLLVEQILMPQKRYEEAIVWLYDSIDADLGHESWVSITNLGIIKLRQANQWAGIAVDKFDNARSIFQTVIHSEVGLQDKAQEYLDAINVGKAKKYIEKIMYPRESNIYQYFSGILKEKSFPSRTHESFGSSRGLTIRELTRDAMETLKVPLNGSNSDAAALVFFDFLEEDQPDFDEAKSAVLSGAPTVEALRLIRRRAITGEAEAAFVMSEYLRRTSESDDYKAWLNVAIAQGYAEIEE